MNGSSSRRRPAEDSRWNVLWPSQVSRKSRMAPESSAFPFAKHAAFSEVQSLSLNYAARTLCLSRSEFLVRSEFESVVPSGAAATGDTHVSRAQRFSRDGGFCAVDEWVDAGSGDSNARLGNSAVS
jgi:hypothetical protein